MTTPFNSERYKLADIQLTGTFGKLEPSKLEKTEVNAVARKIFMIRDFRGQQIKLFGFLRTEIIRSNLQNKVNFNFTMKYKIIS